MRLVVTGGGTGGHVFPALAVGLEAVARGWNVRYFGSLRGQEQKACDGANLAFRGFASEPVYRLWTPAGIRSVARLIRATAAAAKALRQEPADIVFSTGGYASAPIVQAARRLKIPFVLHEQNSVPGRTNRLTARHAECVCTVFHETRRHFPGVRLERTGMPIRRELREGAQGNLLGPVEPAGLGRTVLVVGGSQGSASLNDAALATAVRMAQPGIQWIHVAGVAHFESTMNSLKRLGKIENYALKSYLDAPAMASALFHADVVLCRSGAGTLAEIAAFRKPALLVPYPFAFAQHQLHNAREFEGFGAAEVIQQDELQPSRLEESLLGWLDHPPRLERARQGLAEWDVPDSVDRILNLLDGVRR